MDNQESLWNQLRGIFTNPNTSRRIHSYIDQPSSPLVENTPLEPVENLMFRAPAHHMVNRVLGSPEQMEENNLMSSLPLDDPQRKETEQRKLLEMVQTMALSMASPQPSLSNIKQKASLHISNKELEALRNMRSGNTKGLTFGDMQKANQRMKGLDLLSDFDNASQAHDTSLMRDIVSYLNSLPPNSPYAPYTKSLSNLITNLPQ